MLVYLGMWVSDITEQKDTSHVIAEKDAILEWQNNIIYKRNNESLLHKKYKSCKSTISKNCSFTWK